MNIIFNERFLSFLKALVPFKMNSEIVNYLLEDWVDLRNLRDQYLRWVRHQKLEYTIHLCSEYLIHTFGYVNLCLKEIRCESCEALYYFRVYLPATFRGLKALQLFINLGHQYWTQD
jgi:hypothetical protein